MYLSRVGQLLSNFLDFDSLQVLRGPQGTLFGKNTTGGALLLTSVKPQLYRYDGSYELTVGDYGTLLARAASNIPVSQTFALRVAGLISDSDGYVETRTAATATTAIGRVRSRGNCSISQLPL